MIETRIDAVGYMAQLRKEVITDYDVTDLPLADIVEDFLGYQLNSNPITLGTIEPDVDRSIKIDQDDLLGALLRLHESVGGYIYVDQARALQWKLNIGENKGQQIRYKKNLKGITRHTDFTNYAHRIYCYGDGEGAGRVKLGNLVTTVQVATVTDNCLKYWWYNAPITTWEWAFQVALANAIVSGNYAATIFKYGGGMRFLCPVPAGSTILDAELIFTAYGSFAADTVRSRIKGELALNAAAFTTVADYDARVMTAAIVTWDAISGWTDNSTYESPDLSAIIQEIINQGGWAAFNGLVLFWQDHEGRSTAAPLVIRGAYSAKTGIAPQLRIYYTPPAPVDYVEDLTSKGLYGESVRIFVDKSITDETTLAEFANLKLAEMKQPYIAYTVDMANLEAVGWTFERLKLGSVVKVIDEDLAIDVQTRIVKIIWNLSEPLNTKIEVANMSKDVIESLGRDYRWRQKFY